MSHFYQKMAFGVLTAWLLSFAACRSSDKSTKLSDLPVDASASVESLMDPGKLTKIKALLPKVAYNHLQNILNSPQTIWYDHEVMPPSYQDSLGANLNSKWPNLVAASESVIAGMHDRQKHRWQFPFSTTAGTDNSTNVEVVNFISLPESNGRLVSIPIWKVRKNDNRIEWMWVYPVGTTLGEMLLIKDGDNLLPSEIRVRTRYGSGWATNVFRPFPTARSLADEIKTRRSNWSSQPNLQTLVKHLENQNTLKPKSLAGKAAFAKTFKQDGWIDTMPDFGDAALVRELLTTTVFKSAYNVAWKDNGTERTFAANTDSAVSIVPNAYDAGLIAVNEESCMRCHKEGGRLVSEFYDDLYLYGELWGKDGIFSFYPFDQSLYSRLRLDGAGDNRRIHPKLKQMGIFEEYDAGKHVTPQYPSIPAH